MKKTVKSLGVRTVEQGKKGRKKKKKQERGTTSLNNDSCRHLVARATGQPQKLLFAYQPLCIYNSDR